MNNYKNVTTEIIASAKLTTLRFKETVDLYHTFIDEENERTLQIPVSMATTKDDALEVVSDKHGIDNYITVTSHFSYVNLQHALDLPSHDSKNYIVYLAHKALYQAKNFS